MMSFQKKDNHLEMPFLQLSPPRRRLAAYADSLRYDDLGAVGARSDGRSAFIARHAFVSDIDCRGLGNSGHHWMASGLLHIQHTVNGTSRWRVRIFQRRQRLGIERAGKHRVNQVRHGGTRGGKEEDGEQANESAHQQLYSLYATSPGVEGTRA
jgi:hypothetical protein